MTDEGMIFTFVFCAIVFIIYYIYRTISRNENDAKNEILINAKKELEKEYSKHVKYCPVCGMVESFGRFERCFECGSDLVNTNQSLRNYLTQLNTENVATVQAYIRELYVYQNNPLFDPEKKTAREKSSQELQDHIKKVQSQQEQFIQTKNIPHCPTCGSTNIKRISTGNKVASAAALGVFSVGHVSKTFKCQNCKYEW